MSDMSGYGTSPADAYDANVREEEEDGSYCPKCEEFKDDLEVFHEMPNGDYICQSCYESEIDAVHDMMKDRLYEGE